MIFVSAVAGLDGRCKCRGATGNTEFLVIVVCERGWGDGVAVAFLIGDETLFLDEFGGAAVVGVMVVEFVDDGVNHDGLFVDC